MNFKTAKTTTPTVIVSACYLNQVPQQNSIATWVEVCNIWQSQKAVSSHSNHQNQFKKKFASLWNLQASFDKLLKRNTTSSSNKPTKPFYQDYLRRLFYYAPTSLSSNIKP